MQEVLLVTGGAGFVGSHLVRRLLQEAPDARIVSLDNYFTGTLDNHVPDERAVYINGSTMDITKIWSTEGLPPPSRIFHLGEYSRVVRSLEEHETTWEFNLRGTKEVVEFAHRHEARIIYAGSSSKFGNDGQDERLNPYAWTKAKNIEYLQNYASWYGLDYVVTYFYNVYGSGQVKRGRYATVIGIFEDCYERGVPLPVVSPGTQTRDFTHVDDIVSGIIACAGQGSGDGYLLGTGREWQISDVAALFGMRTELIPPLPGERTRGRADISKAQGLGWRPKHSLEDYVAAFKKSAARQ